MSEEWFVAKLPDSWLVVTGLLVAALGGAGSLTVIAITLWNSYVSGRKNKNSEEKATKSDGL